LPENLGRLNASSIDGDIDGDGDIDKLHVYGGRSFSIYDECGTRVFDSGDELEWLTSELTPTLFNANDGVASKFDQRSDDKGCEPEGVEIGVIGGCTYAFIGLERAGCGVMVYDVSKPSDPLFLQYARRDGDVAPEGIKFVPAEDSPSGKPLLLIAHETSQTLSVYEIEIGEHLRALTAPSVVPHSTTVLTVEGAFGGIEGDITWWNQSSGAMGVAGKGAGTWTAGIPLAVGVNQIEFSGTGGSGKVYTDHLTITRGAGPEVDIKANGVNGPVTIRSRDTLSATIHLKAGSFAGQMADWWVLAYDVTRNVWRHYVAPFGIDTWRAPWMGGTSLQTPLFDVPAHEILHASGLQVGQYILYFGVDLRHNGTFDFDVLTADGVQVNVVP
jgi:hypothetical protein